MKLLNESPILVVVGGWNHNIFKPQWVEKYLVPDEEILIEYPLSGNLIASPHYKTSSIRFGLIANKMVFFAIKSNDEESYTRIQNIIEKIAEYLPHTPVDSFGINFSYEFPIGSSSSLENHLQFEDQKYFEQHGYTLKETILKRSLKHKSCDLNLSIKKRFSDSIVEFNFHNSLGNLSEIKEKLDNYSILSRKNEAHKILTEAYGTQ